MGALITAVIILIAVVVYLAYELGKENGEQSGWKAGKREAVRRGEHLPVAHFTQNELQILRTYLDILTLYHLDRGKLEDLSLRWKDRIFGEVIIDQWKRPAYSGADLLQLEVKMTLRRNSPASEGFRIVGISVWTPAGTHRLLVDERGIHEVSQSEVGKIAV